MLKYILWIFVVFDLFPVEKKTAELENQNQAITVDHHTPCTPKAESSSTVDGADKNIVTSNQASGQQQNKETTASASVHCFFTTIQN